MHRLSYLLSILAILVSLMVPTLLELGHHEDGLAATHFACDGDCGCMCHVGMSGVLRVMEHDVFIPVSSTIDSYVPFQPLTVVFLLDRPPELFS